MHSFTLELPHHRYPVCVGASLLARAGDIIAPLLPAPRCIIIADETVLPHYGDALRTSLEAHHIRTDIIGVPSGEQSKSIAALEQLLLQLLDKTPDRNTTLVALGGGVIGDLCGFAASILLRGVPFVQVPTTLLSMVDSSVGGKTGINMPTGKNLVGSFYQPLAVIADTDTLRSLSARELRAGYAEIVKMGVVADAPFFDWLCAHGAQVLERAPEPLSHAILTACQGKARIVAADEKEKDQRALLNFGHTFGHALEAEHRYGQALRHGEAVAVGMVMAARLSAQLGLCNENVCAQLTTHLRAAGLPASLNDIPPPDGGWHPQRVAAHFAADKKTMQGQLNFVLLRGMGEGFVARDVSLEQATQAIR